MKYNYAVDIVTMGDVHQYFAGPKWPIQETLGDKFIAESIWDVKVSLKKLSTNYFVEIYDLEDAADNEELVTDDPVGAIKSFLAKGIPEGEKLLDQVASDPIRFAAFLKNLANSVDKSTRISRLKVKRILRRASIIPSLRLAGGQAVEKDVDALLGDLKQKGWKVKKNGEGPLAEIVIDIGGIYEAKISAESITWEYAFSINGTDEATVSGTTDDPLDEFSKWRKSPDTKEAYRMKKESDDSRRKQNADKETVAPNRGNTTPTVTVPPV